jgi:hypothetical protein
MARKRKYIRRGRQNRACEVCGKVFLGREKARFDSNACRQKAYRQRYI